jgi:uncharacterized protein YpuA (DUF1002 family)
MSHHFTVKVSDPNNPAALKKHQQLFAGIFGVTGKTSETQLQDWKNLYDNIPEVWDSNPRGQEKHLMVEEMAAMLSGLNTDHAQDQKKLHQLLTEWKKLCD